MQSSHKYQRFALDINNSIIDIQKTNDLNNQQYFCPYCHKEMIPKRGNIRKPHFAHKADKCSYDKYLHSIAEIMIMDWFNKNGTIMLSMNNYGKCDRYSSCAFYDKMSCNGTIREQFDLKKYYSKCIREYRYGGFIADLYCESDAYPNSPIFIEIFVTHECSQEKKSSGIRIIELAIQSEEDILDIVKSTKLIESEKVRLYNFKRNGSPVNKVVRPFQKYVLYPTLKSYVERDISCRNYDQHRKGIYEISMPYDDCIYSPISSEMYMVGKVKAYLDGYLKRDCQICKWQAETMEGDVFCKLYKKCGNPKLCKDNDASRCSMFRKNAVVINRAISIFNEYLEDGNADIWKINEPKDSLLVR